MRPLLPEYVPKRGRPVKIPGPLEKLPKVIQGTTTHPKKGTAQQDRYVASKKKQPTTASVHHISFPNSQGECLFHYLTIKMYIHAAT